jgi:type II secretory pathway pseudopilin PulG
MVEMLIVIVIIAILAAILIPAIRAARQHVRAGATRAEIGALETAFDMYFADWGEYPPDRTDNTAPNPLERDLNPGQCLVYYLGGPNGGGFRVSDGFTRNGGPYFDFRPDRLAPPPAAWPNRDVNVFVDALGPRGGVSYYQFDNNDSEPDLFDVSNVHPNGVDIWSAGPDGQDAVSAQDPDPDRDNIRDLLDQGALGDDIGNW